MLLLLSALFLCIGDIFPKKMAVTFDDLPIVKQGSISLKTQRDVFYSILDVLDRYRLKVTGFVVGNKLTDPIHFKLLDSFVKRGHHIGNHSYSHPDLNRTAIDAYKQDIIKCGLLISPYMNTKYFRYPLLHRGDSKMKKESIQRFLKMNGYTIVPVSIDNDEYAFNGPAIDAFRKGDQRELSSIKARYLTHMREKIRYFYQLSLDKIGRDTKHILLLHWSFLNHLFLDDLLRMIKADDWQFISLQEALTDPVYRLEDNYIGPQGLGWVERIEID